VECQCVNDDKNIAVCCWGNEELGIKPSIKLSSKQGDLIHEFYMTDNNEQPEYITYGNGKHFVSYYDKYYISVFDKNGVFLYKFGEKGKMDGQFNGIRGLAVYGPDLFLVCDTSNTRVHLLTQEGLFVRSFGSQAVGALRPQSSMVANFYTVSIQDGGSVVCDGKFESYFLTDFLS
jgi:hypothetical protein